MRSPCSSQVYSSLPCISDTRDVTKVPQKQVFYRKNSHSSPVENPSLPYREPLCKATGAGRAGPHSQPSAWGTDIPKPVVESSYTREMVLLLLTQAAGHLPGNPGLHTSYKLDVVPHSAVIPGLGAPS